LLAWVYAWGWTFVDLFFLISGYIFAHVYLSDDRLQTPGALKDFAVARIARLYPLHLVMLLVCAVLFWGAPGNNLFTFGAHLVMMQAFAPPISMTFNWPAWSISIEVVCYFLFALGAAGGHARLMRLTVTAVLTGGLLIAVLSKPGTPLASDLLSRGFLGFFTGQLLWHYRAHATRVPAWALSALLLGGLMVMEGPYSVLLPFGILVWPATLLLALRLPLLESRVMLWLGDRSYAIYLVHMPLLQMVVAQTGPVAGSAWFILAVNLAFIVTVLALSELSFRLIENPARRAIRSAWQKASPAGSPTVQA
jgi:peptidoglycan/LPS O-acetylase OafA/YrhL